MTSGKPPSSSHSANGRNEGRNGYGTHPHAHTETPRPASPISSTSANGHPAPYGASDPRHAPRPQRGAAPQGFGILIVGDAMPGPKAAAPSPFTVPGARVEHVGDWFEAIARLNRKAYDAVVAPTSAVHRRPEAAVRTLREAAGNARVILVSDPAHEILSRKMLDAGVDEYLIRPVSEAELAHAVLGGSLPVLTPPPPPVASTPPAPARTPTPEPSRRADAHPDRVSTVVSAAAPVAGGQVFTMAGLAVAEVVLEALVSDPARAAQTAVQKINDRLPASVRLDLLAAADRDPVVPPHMTLLSRVLPRLGPGGQVSGIATVSTPADATRVLCLQMDRSFDESAGRDLLDQIAVQMARLLELQDRHARLQKIAITDDLTGLYNVRYFRHFLEKILVRARDNRFPVTLLLFDIDNFKKYNDQFSHACGDEILRQTGKMMRRCVRDHDLVARLGGDEFAVVFWEKEGPRQALSGQPGSNRPPQSPVMIFQRFKRMIAGHDFSALGPTGQGHLTISGGLAVYPYDARDPDELIAAADKALMFGAKKSGKNTLHLVGQDEEQ